jgi:hypothetical protein
MEKYFLYYLFGRDLPRIVGGNFSYIVLTLLTVVHLFSTLAVVWFNNSVVNRIWLPMHFMWNIITMILTPIAFYVNFMRYEVGTDRF